ncbi:ATP-binding protein [Micromonospora thermarum]|uniref:AAA family ATPase n=1 Tax=Micromonospora thermarum TaxID=2720024 RepID=A0ABX0Z2A2_9ACTN|nr:ATP-binding protein [Micromonospora thermarum]NJP31932.1 AAA family ATPase [Micromonospora thermarum]
MNSDGNTLAGQLGHARRQAFVGRATELAILGSALAAEPPGPAVVFIHGPAGIGKSTLLHRFADSCRDAGHPVVHLDGRLLDPAPRSFEQAAATAIAGGRAVLLVDAYEHCQGLETWLRERFLPRLPDGVLTVLAGRRPPAADWTADPAWGVALRVVPLAELPRTDAAELLRIRGVPEPAREAILDFAGGYPLALALAAARGHTGRYGETGWKPTPDAVTTLMRQLLDDVPSAAHLTALRVAAHSFMVTEGLLRAVVGEHDSGPLLHWLCDLPFVQLAPSGVFLHSLVKEVVDADFRWRDAQRYADLHATIGSYFLEQVQTVPEAQVVTAMRGLTYLKRYGAAAPYYASVGVEGDVYEDAVTPADLPAMRRMTEQCEGPEATALLEFWYARRPGDFLAYRRSGTGELVAYLAWLRLARLNDDEKAADPVVATACAHAERVSPPRPGEQVLIARSFIDPQAYHQRSLVMQLMQLHICVGFVRTPRLSWTFVVYSNPEVWDPLMTHLGQQHVPETPVVDGRAFTIYAFDWRLLPLTDWFTHTAPGAIDAPLEPPALSGPAAVILSRDDFEAAVREALRDWHHADGLATNRLLATRLVANRTDAATTPVAVLRGLLSRAVDELGQDPRRAILREVVSTTYFDRVTTQKAAAARLMLPWSTYRRHLQRGVRFVAERLWTWDVNSGPSLLPPAD